MRKLHTARRGACAALACALLGAGAAAAQTTTFETSNNPAAAVKLAATEGADAAVRLELRQSRHSRTYARISQRAVLRERATGVSVPVSQLDVDVDERGFETYTLSFEGVTAGLEYDFLDPLDPNSSLFVAGIRQD